MFIRKKIRVNGWAYKGCESLMKYVTTMILSEHAHYETFCHEEPWESKHLLDATRRTQCILDFHNEKSDLHQLASKQKSSRWQKQCVA